ncbi:uncharacterized protein [Diadema setosum]|uniref:uncharacterized protein n=1 Tax=Diadema setosum TaxID=31175 RepID=UPI003B3A8A9C
MHRYVRLVVGLASPLLGIPGNILIFVVFSRRRPKNVTDVGIMALAVNDLISSSFNFVKVFMSFFGDDDVRCIIEIVSLRSGILTAAFLTTSIAVYRAKAIITPFSRPFSLEFAMWLSLFCFLAAFVFNSPFIFLTRARLVGGIAMCDSFGDVAWARSAYSWLQSVVFSSSSLVAGMLYSKIFKVIREQQVVRSRLTNGLRMKRACPSISKELSSAVTSNSQIPPVVDIAVEATLSSTLVDNHAHAVPTNNSNFGAESQEGPYVTSTPVVHVKTIQQSPANKSIRVSEAKDGQPTSSTRMKVNSGADERRTTAMLVIVSFVFFVTWLPSVAFDMIGANKGSNLNSLHQQVMPVVSILYYGISQLKYVNHVINVFVYGVINRRFRLECRKLLCR